MNGQSRGIWEWVGRLSAVVGLITVVIAFWPEKEAPRFDGNFTYGFFVYGKRENAAKFARFIERTENNVVYLNMTITEDASSYPTDKGGVEVCSNGASIFHEPVDITALQGEMLSLWTWPENSVDVTDICMSAMHPEAWRIKKYFIVFGESGSGDSVTYQKPRNTLTSTTYQVEGYFNNSVVREPHFQYYKLEPLSDVEAKARLSRQE